MAIKTLNWALFVFLILFYIILYIATWAFVNDKDNKENKGIGILFFFCGFIAALVFIPSSEIFNNKAAIILWKTLASITLLSYIIVIISNDQIRKQKSYIWGFILSAALTILPFVINISITIKNTEKITFNNHYSIDKLTIISAIFVILAIVSFIVLIVSTNKTRRTINRLSNTLSYYQNEYDHTASSFRKPYEKILREEMFLWINQLESRIANIIKAKEAKDKNSNTNELTTNEIHNLNNKIDDIRKVLFLLGDKMYDKTTADFNLIRDLNHFFATPFATIEANIELLKNTKGINNSHLEKISNSIQLCKCIIETYRECLSFSDNHDNVISSLKQTIECAFSTYTERNNKNLKSLTTTNIPDKFLSYNNHYLISIILPLLENAIQAAPNNTEIEIVFDSKNCTIRISNLCEKVPSLKDLKTQGYSSKENHQGTGIMIVQSLLSLKNRGILESDIENDKVIQTIKLNKNE